MNTIVALLAPESKHYNLMFENLKGNIEAIKLFQEVDKERKAIKNL